MASGETSPGTSVRHSGARRLRSAIGPARPVGAQHDQPISISSPPFLRRWETLAAGFFAGLAGCEGDAARAESLLAQLAPGAALGWAAYHLVRLEFDQAADWTAKAIKERDPRVVNFLPYHENQFEVARSREDVESAGSGAVTARKPVAHS